ncbi:immunity protein Imm33 domain-containing protein [Catellatospora sichuanensis]|uniref:immunity protein Imm33 domain-containing protein n=1 Tax=Catellatospora sichuanensis TaxID=1969805 RepID=UPI0011822C0B|nr:hypothetical protein [Catellatospora sichuanensis]
MAQAIEQLESQAGALLDILEDYADGLRDGLSVQAGWTPFKLVAQDADRFDVLAPDLATKVPDRMGWTSDLTLALWVLNGQVTTARALDGTEPQSMRFTDTVLCYRGIENANRLVMSRTQRQDSPDDSGWYIDVFPNPEQSRQPADFVRWPAFQLLRINRHLTRALLLPVGYGAVVCKDQIDALLNLTTMRIEVRGPL